MNKRVCRSNNNIREGYFNFFFFLKKGTKSHWGLCDFAINDPSGTFGTS